MNHQTKISRAKLEAAAKAAHLFIRWNHTPWGAGRWEQSNLTMKRNRRALARAVLRAAGVVR